MTDVDERVAWLTTRLDELERIATDAKCAGLDDEFPFWVDVDDEWNYGAAKAYREAFPPSAALARVEADRRILARHSEGALGFCDGCNEHAGGILSYPTWPCPEVRDLLSAHRFAPGFREEWLEDRASNAESRAAQ